MPFDNDKLLSVNNQSQSNYHQSNLQLSKNLPFGNGYGYHLTATDNSNYPLEGELTIQQAMGLFSARYANVNQENNYEVNARGSLIHFARHTFPARYVEQSFALVEVPSFKDVAVYSRNQLVGKTNSRGYLYIPETLPYQLNEIVIDARSLPFNTLIPTTSKITTPYWKSGALVRFDVLRTQPILLSLILSDGSYVPAGAELSLAPNKEILPVAYKGQVFINAINATSVSGEVKWSNHSCYFEYKLPTARDKTIKDTVLCASH